MDVEIRQVSEACRGSLFLERLARVGAEIPGCFFSPHGKWDLIVPQSGIKPILCIKHSLNSWPQARQVLEQRNLCLLSFLPPSPFPPLSLSQGGLTLREGLEDSVLGRSQVLRVVRVALLGPAWFMNLVPGSGLPMTPAQSRAW